MKLARIDKAIEDCQIHLTNSNAFGTEIEAYLTQYLLILISATVEEEIEKIVAMRASKTKDKHIESFVNSCCGDMFKSFSSGQIAGILGRFGPEYKEKFKKKVSGLKAQQLYDNIISNRHSTAHKSGSNVSFHELVNSYEQGHIVLDAFSEIMLEENPEEIIDTFFR